jgi:predicted SprT family Zn-dependent metalloprotease
MPLLRQLDFAFQQRSRLAPSRSNDPPRLQRDIDLELAARTLLRAHGADRIAPEVHVEWNPRLKTCAGRANYQQKLITLNPQLVHHPAEVDRTLRHELAHFLAQYRTGRRRTLPHGVEWRQACRDLEIGDEKRCHSLPLAGKTRRQRFLYRCPKCWRDFPRARRIQRAIACLSCCRAHNLGKFDARFRLRLIGPA